MAYGLEDRLVVGVASSALFDLAKSDAYFKKHGEAKYRVYQDKRLDKTLQPVLRSHSFSDCWHSMIFGLAIPSSRSSSCRTTTR